MVRLGCPRLLDRERAQSRRRGFVAVCDVSADRDAGGYPLMRGATPNDGTLNPGNAVSKRDVKIRDYDATNKAVPDVMAELLRYCGFVMVFFTDTFSDGTPLTSLKIVRRDALASSAPKLLYLAADGTDSLNLSANNTTALHLARDLNELVNQWTVETALRAGRNHGISGPGFQPSLERCHGCRSWFLSSNLTNATAHQRRMYRWYIADECSDGHWNVDRRDLVTDTPIDFSPIFPPNDDGTPDLR